MRSSTTTRSYAAEYRCGSSCTKTDSEVLVEIAKNSRLSNIPQDPLHANFLISHRPMSSPTATGDSTAKETHIVLAMGLGSIILAAAMSGQGVLALIYGDFASPWQPIPEWLPWRQGVAYLSGVVMLAGGVGLCIKPSAMRSAGVLTIDL